MQLIRYRQLILLFADAAHIQQLEGTELCSQSHFAREVVARMSFMATHYQTPVPQGTPNNLMEKWHKYGDSH